MGREFGFNRQAAIQKAERGEIRSVRTRVGRLYDPQSVEENKRQAELEEQQKKERRKNHGRNLVVG